MNFSIENACAMAPADLHPGAIAGACSTSAGASVAIEVVLQTGSTNADLLARVESLAVPTLLVAQRQSAGRGRAGRTWQSDDASLTFSLAWPFELPLACLVGLPLAVGVAVAEVLAARNVPVQLKWPNDILLDGAKLAGILIETAASKRVPGRVWTVIGIGINLMAPGVAAAMPVGSAALPATERNVLMAQLLDALAPTLSAFAQTGFAPWASRWNALHAHAGQAVDIIDRGQVRQSGTALGVDASGQLLLQGAGATVAVLAGDVSLRPAVARHTDSGREGDDAADH